MQFPEPEIVESAGRRIVALARDCDRETRNLVPQLFKAFFDSPDSGKTQKAHSLSMMRTLCIQSVLQTAAAEGAVFKRYPDDPEAQGDARLFEVWAPVQTR